MKNRYIVDIDACFDSFAAAYLAASADSKRLACVTTVFSPFADVETSTRHALQALSLAGSKARVYAGCAQPMVKKQSYGRDFNVIEHRREINVRNCTLKCAPTDIPSAEKTHAVTQLLNLLRPGNETFDIILLGPATNLACALRIDPTIAKNIGTLYVRAGAVSRADVTPYAERNAWADPEALQIVTHCGCDVCMLPLDVCLDAALSNQFLNSMEHNKKPGSKMMFEGMNNAAVDCYTPGVPLPGCMMIACVEEPAIVQSISKEVMDVCLDFSHGEGRTLFADANLMENNQFHLCLIRAADAAGFETWMRHRLF